MEELGKSTEIIGYDEVVLLGYRDSGMPGTPENEDPRSFVQAPIEEAVGRLVAVIRRVRPQVVVTYGDDQRGYPHPDHLRVHDIRVDPTSPFWFGLPPGVARTIHPYDEYVLARTHVDGAGGDGASPEDDLFAGVRDRVSR